MLVRILLLLLLLAAFVTPVAQAAPCHGAEMTMTMAATPAQAMPAHHPAPAHEAAHACLGCIPPGNWQVARIGKRFAAPIAHPVTRVARLDLGTGTAPALPPPRAA